jgi:hypothetical protein
MTYGMVAGCFWQNYNVSMIGSWSNFNPITHGCDAQTIGVTAGISGNQLEITLYTTPATGPGPQPLVQVIYALNGGQTAFCNDDTMVFTLQSIEEFPTVLVSWFGSGCTGITGWPTSVTTTWQTGTATSYSSGGIIRTIYVPTCP